MTPNELLNKKFSKTFGFGYRVDEVERYMELVSKSISDMIEENDALSKKLEVLADKINDYRNDEESLRTALLGAQKLGDSVIRESKNKAAGVMRDANQKAELMIDNAKRQLEREEKGFENLQNEVKNFKSNLFELYKQHLAVVSNMPGEIAEGNILEDKKPVNKLESNTDRFPNNYAPPTSPSYEQREPEKMQDPPEIYPTSTENPTAQNPAYQNTWSSTDDIEETNPRTKQETLAQDNRWSFEEKEPAEDQVKFIYPKEAPPQSNVKSWTFGAAIPDEEPPVSPKIKKWSFGTNTAQEEPTDDLDMDSFSIEALNRKIAQNTDEF